MTRKALILFSFILLAASACKKDDKPPQEPIDYMVQTIPDIHALFKDHVDLIDAMDTLLHFGDTPPLLSKLIEDTTDQHKDTVLGFCNDSLVLKHYHKSDPNAFYPGPPELVRGTYQFLFNNQHRGVASLHFTSINHDNGPDDHYIESASRRDSVFIMGEKPYFTVYFFQQLKKDLVVSGYHPQDVGARQAFIISGEVTDNGIKDLFVGFKVYGYDIPTSAGIGALSIGDIVVYYRDFMPFTYWDTTPKYTN